MKTEGKDVQSVTTLNGVTFTPQMFTVLSKWQSNMPIDDSAPEIYVSEISQLQDFLCLLLAECGINEEYKEKAQEITLHMTSLIYLKKDLEQFIQRKE